jgi:hypothetical protein
VTTIGALYDAMDAYFRFDRDLTGREWAMYKRFRPTDDELNKLIERARTMWDRAGAAVPAWRQVRDGPEGTAGELRDRKTGGNLWVRPIGTMIFADAMSLLRRAGLTESEAIRRIAAAPALLNDAPWAGLLWDPLNHRMITRAENRRVATQILFYLCGGDLRTVKSSLSSLRDELEGLVADRQRIPHPHAELIQRQEPKEARAQ